MFHKRKHIRLRGFDYSSGNAYFITICIKDFVSSFGEIRSSIMGFSDIGNMAAYYLQRIPELHASVVLDEFIIMPNHLHCIIELPTKPESNHWQVNHFAQPIAGSVSTIINQYKGAVKKWCNANGHAHFEWQGRFYDHVIRDDDSYRAIKNYIRNNPAKWEGDKLFRR